MPFRVVVRGAVQSTLKAMTPPPDTKTRCAAAVRLAIAAAVTLTLLAGAGCNKKRLIKKNPNRQHFVDISAKYLPAIPGDVQEILFSWVDRDALKDVIVHVHDNKRESKFIPLLNREKEGFAFNRAGKWASPGGGRVRFLAVGDLNGDRAEDIVFIREGTGPGGAGLLMNNKKGYYYKKIEQVLPRTHAGVDRVTVADIDHDRDLDLLFTGRELLNAEGRPHKHQLQLWINNGQGDFQDQSALLLPRVPPGASGASIADYDGDGVVDLFLTYATGQNRLLLNNGVGKFADKTRAGLPVLRDESLHADWADFDGDKDNDLLVVNRAIEAAFRDHGKETSYFLINDGTGRFTKLSHKKLPAEPARRVYLLDANGNGIPDALILTASGTLYLQGRGKWKFSDETERRLPRLRRFTEMSFGDVNDDSYLDLVALYPEKSSARLWLNRFK